jgi:hypothetical protein
MRGFRISAISEIQYSKVEMLKEIGFRELSEETMWEWLQSLSGGAADFLGSLTGAAIGLLAIVVGALFNASLNRKRDDRLRGEEARSVASALKAELSGINRTLLTNAETLGTPLGGFMTPDLSQSVRIGPAMLSKIGLFDTETIQTVLDAYIIVDQYAEQLILLGGTLSGRFPAHRRPIFMQREQAGHVATMNRNISAHILRAIGKLDDFLARH